MAVHENNCVVKYTTWPVSETTVDNEMGAAAYDGYETTNRYTTWHDLYTAQTISSNNETIVIPGGSSIDTLPAFTIELLFKWDSSTVSPAYFFGKGPWFYVKYEKATDTLTIFRSVVMGGFTPPDIYYKQWHGHPGPFTNGSDYHLQISWGDSNSTPLVKCNNASKTMTHDTHPPDVSGWDWYSDSAYQVKVLNSSSNNAAVRGALTIFRLHDTNLSDTGSPSQLTDNYTADWEERVVSNKSWTQTTVKSTASSSKLPAIEKHDHWWYQISSPAATATTTVGTFAVLTAPTPPTAAATTKVSVITSGRFVDVPPIPHYTLRRVVPYIFTLYPSVEEEYE